MIDTNSLAILITALQQKPAIAAPSGNLILVLAALGPLVAALAAWFSKKTSEQVKLVHTLADGNLSKITAALAVANEKILGLEKLIAAGVESKKDAQLKAENDAQELLTAAVLAASKKVQEDSNQPN